ncbi:uncharacterized protein V6R79_003664 [Siganus canaliculatus]
MNSDLISLHYPRRLCTGVARHVTAGGAGGALRLRGTRVTGVGSVLQEAAGNKETQPGTEPFYGPLTGVKAGVPEDQRPSSLVHAGPEAAFPGPQRTRGRVPWSTLDQRPRSLVHTGPEAKFPGPPRTRGHVPGPRWTKGRVPWSTLDQRPSSLVHPGPEATSLVHAGPEATSLVHAGPEARVSVPWSTLDQRPRSLDHAGPEAVFPGPEAAFPGPRCTRGRSPWTRDSVPKHDF